MKVIQTNNIKSIYLTISRRKMIIFVRLLQASPPLYGFLLIKAMTYDKTSYLQLFKL